MSDTLIRVESTGKEFCRSLKKSLWYGMQDLGRELLGGRGSRDELRPDEFWAVKDLSFELKRGECLGLIGHNGAGKTTLLRMLNGLIKPDQGRIEMRGRVSALIALGAGFNPILSGRENIHVNASVLGLSKREIDEQIDGIIDFAEIGDFIDAPVQSYSSGMAVRLGFAVATALNPDILLLDEVLAVGDIRFQAKCFTRIAEIKNTSAVIFVSHQMSSIARMSDRVLVLKNGMVQATGTPQEGIQEYLKLMDTGRVAGKVSYEGGNEIVIRDVRISLTRTVRQDCNMQRMAMDVEMDIRSNIDAENILLDFVFRTPENIAAAECPSTFATAKLSLLRYTDARISLKIDPVPLATGTYLCSLFVLDASCTRHYHAWINFTEITIYNDDRFTSPMQLPAVWNYSVCGAD